MTFTDRFRLLAPTLVIAANYAYESYNASILTEVLTILPPKALPLQYFASVILIQSTQIV